MKHTIGILLALTAISMAFSHRPAPLGDLLVEGPTVVAPGSRAVLRVAAFATEKIGEVKPAVGARVVAVFDGRTVYEGATDPRGGADVAFVVPDLKEGEYDFSVEVDTAGGKVRHAQKIRLLRAVKIMLVSDKPLYQPGQLIHLRALALADLTLKPHADMPLLFEIEDAKGNKVFKQRVTTSAYGVAAVDFQLADEVNMGDFRVNASLGEFKAEKTVNVSKYVLPKFKIELKTEKSFYQPLSVVKGSIQADYFFGKPVSTADVEITASTFDAAAREFAKLKLKTDAKGHATFELTLPDYFVGTPLNQGNASVQIEAKVTDAADHAQQASRSVPVSEQPLRIHAVAESGKIVPGVENIVYVITSDPNGASMESVLSVKVAGKVIEQKTNDLGYAEIRVTPEGEHLAQRNELVLPLEITAKTKDGAALTKTVDLATEPAGDTLLLRADKSVYAAGDRITIDVLGTAQSSDVFIDVVKAGQTLVTATAEMKKGRAQYSLVAPAEAFGSIEIHAYAVTKYGDIVRDVRVAYLQPPQDLAVKISTDQRQYKPGDLAKIQFHVTDKQGKGVAAALGVIIVDDAVYALQEMQPGLEKVYFMLEKELASPKIEFCPGGARVTDLVGMPEVRAAQQDVGKMLFAGAAPAARRWTRNTLAERHAALAQQVEQIYWAVYNGVGQKGKEITERRDGKRVFKADALDTIKAIHKNVNLKDPWGRDLTMEALAGLDGRFAMPVFNLQFSQGQYWNLFNALAQYCLQRDFVEKKDGKWSYRPEALERLIKDGKIAKEQALDFFGDPITLESAAKIYESFLPEKLALLTNEQRRQALFNVLVRRSNLEDYFAFQEGGVIVYQAGVLERVARLESLNATDADGTPMTLERLAKTDPAFAAPNLAKIADGRREQAIVEKLQEIISNDGVEAVASFDLNTTSWNYLPKLLDKWVRTDGLPASAVRSVGGAQLSIAGIVKKHPAAALGNMTKIILWNRMNQVYQALNQYGHKNRDKYLENNQFKFPEGIVNLMIMDKVLERATLKDPWGGSIRVGRLERRKNDPLWWNLTWNRIEAAGPDRTFGTSDDIGAEVAQHMIGLAPDFGGAVFYQPTLINNWWGDLGVELEEHAANFGAPMRDGARNGLGRRREMLARGMVPMAPQAAKAGGIAEMRKAATGNDRFDGPGEGGGQGGGGGVEPTRIREFFPETLLWAPNVITDADGRAAIDLEMADSITSWRLSASANSAGGLLGSAGAGITVFQDFFVDLDLPVSLTQNDSISIPVAVYNYLKEPQTISLKMEAGDWFELAGDPVRNVKAGPDQVQVVYYPIKVKKIGDHKLTVTARGSKLGDAIRREIEVLPDGQRVEQVINGTLSADMKFDLTIPETALDDASKILVKFYPGVFSQIVDGLDGMLQMPGG